MKAQMLICVYKVTKRFPDGKVEATEWDHDEWQDVTHEPMQYQSSDGQFVYAPPSSSFASTMKTVRSVPDETPDPDTTDTRVSLLADDAELW